MEGDIIRHFKVRVFMQSGLFPDVTALYYYYWCIKETKTVKNEVKMFGSVMFYEIEKIKAW